MITYQIIEGATADSSAKVFTPTEEGKAMAHVPGWTMLLDPSYTTDGILNRCQKDSTFEVVTGSVILGTFANGQTSIELSEANQIRLDPKIDFPADAWSVVFVAKPGVRVDAGVQMIVTSNTYTSKDVALGTGFSRLATSLRIYKGGGITDMETRLTYTPEDPLTEKEAVYIITGSSKGMAIYQNGELKASNAGNGTIQVQYKAGEWSVLRGARGSYGMVGVLALDLHQPENETYRNQITSFLKTKYGIA